METLSSIRWPRHLLGMLCAIPLLFTLLVPTVSADDDEGGQTFRIDKAEWRSERNQLRVEGRGSRGQTVSVKNAFADTTYATVTVDRKGKWKVRARRPSPIPCRVQALSQGQVLERDVSNAPSDCAPKQRGDGNQPPVAKDDSYTTPQDQALTVAAPGVLGNDTDPDGDPLTAVLKTDVNNGTLALAPDGAFTYTPNSGFFGDDSFTYAASDGQVEGNTATVTITVQQQGGANQPPTCTIASPANNATFTLPQGGSVAVPFSGSAQDPNGDALDLAGTFTGGTPASAQASGTGSVTLSQTVSYDVAGSYTLSLTGTETGTTEAFNCTASVTITVQQQQGELITDPVSEQPQQGNQAYKVLAANDLGMHCADQDYQIFSILPPFNVVHAQVIQVGADPTLVTPASHPNMSVVYSAAANAQDPVFDPNHPTLPSGLNPPAAALGGTPRANVSINSTSQNDPVAGVFKSNFWDTNPATGNPIGFDAYDNIFFGLLNPGAVVADTGLPVPDSVLLPGCLNNPASCQFGQQVMPGINGPYVANDPKAFDRFDTDFNFFDGVLSAPLGSTIQQVNWWAADGVPATPIDDAGRINAYPLFRIQAKDGGTVVASTDVVLPVASEADCQNCHADPIDCNDSSLPPLLQSNNCTGAAADPDDFLVETLDNAPGDTPEQKLLNAAKINVLRLHDVDHGTDYPSGWGSCDAASNPTDPTAWNGNCLANRTPISCSQCHYSPALDLAQLGPTDDPGNQVFQATVDKSMSAMMHGFHGQFTSLFPTMPPPDQQRDTQGILEQTCYQCHPGKRTQCLRGAMGSAGVVCQDCHGQMADVGRDFTTGGTRVPWASEPKCQSCHTGDASNPNHPGGAIVAPDGIRLLQAYTTDANSPTLRPNSRFAENESLYRLSGNEVTAQPNQGHKGIMCEGCHGSTHAIFPNANPNANDNVASNQLQGHSGTIIECSTCHGNGLSNYRGLGGPHGMHVVGNTRFSDGGHEDSAGPQCFACHGGTSRNNSQGTVLSRAAADRTLDREGGTVTVRKGTEIGCTLCHGSGGDD